MKFIINYWDDNHRAQQWSMEATGAFEASERFEQMVKGLQVKWTLINVEAVEQH